MSEDLKTFMFKYLAVLNNVVVESTGDKQKYALEAYIKFYTTIDKETNIKIGLDNPVPYIIDADYVKVLYDNYDENLKQSTEKRNRGFRNWFRSKKETE